MAKKVRKKKSTHKKKSVGKNKVKRHKKRIAKKPVKRRRKRVAVAKVHKRRKTIKKTIGKVKRHKKHSRRIGSLSGAGEVMIAHKQITGHQL